MYIYIHRYKFSKRSLFDTRDHSITGVWRGCANGPF